MVLRFLAVFILINNVKSELIPQTCEDKAKWIDVHNSWRMMVCNGTMPYQPAAAVMNMMIWDSELATKAANWASRNNYGHNPDNTIPSNRFITGENIFYIGSSDPNAPMDIGHVVDTWVDERWDYVYKNLTPSDIRVAGHYTQVVWSNSMFVGCAASKYYNGYFTIFFVCNYGPAGNWQGQTPYIAGPPSNELVCGTTDCSHPYGDDC